MAKKATRRNKPTKQKTSLAKRDKPKGSGILKTITRNGKKLTLKKWHIAGICIPPTCIVGPDKLPKYVKEFLDLKLEAMKVALFSESKSLQDKAIDTILGDLVAGAYQDKLVAYTTTPSEDYQGNLDTSRRIQKARQSADTHLLNMLKAVRDIKRPPVNVVVKEAGQVNVAEQINQADKQVNIAEKQQP